MINLVKTSEHLHPFFWGHPIVAHLFLFWINNGMWEYLKSKVYVILSEPVCREQRIPGNLSCSSNYRETPFAEFILTGEAVPKGSG
jgi:hypothetical protein